MGQVVADGAKSLLAQGPGREPLRPGGGRFRVLLRPGAQHGEDDLLPVLKPRDGIRVSHRGGDIGFGPTGEQEGAQLGFVVGKGEFLDEGQQLGNVRGIHLLDELVEGLETPATGYPHGLLERRFDLGQ